MKKYLSVFILLGCFFLSFKVISQPVVQINAGSRAPWGTNQYLTIDKNGKCRFYVAETNGHVQDSAMFTITKAQLESFFKKADDVGFFSLQEKYQKGIDGSGIFIALNSNGKKYSVDLINTTDLAQVNELIEALNAILAEHKIRIYYGQSSTSK